MKRFLLIGVALMAFLSCSKDIILDVNRGAAIEFTVAAHTRAHEVTSNTLMTFYATAVDPQQEVNYFSNLPYIKSGEYYHSSPSYYWPGDGAPLNIYAYAPSATDLGVTEDGTSETTLNIGKNTQVLSNFSPAAEIADQQDFITAVKEEFTHPGDGSPVLLEFRHQLVQIEIKAKNSNPGQIYHVKGVKIAQIKSKGDFDFTSQSWTLDNEAKEVYVAEYEDARTLDPYGVSIMNTAGDNITESYSDNAMLLPQTLTSWDPQDDQQNEKKGAYIAVLMKITTSSDASVTTTDENDGYQWVAAPFPAETKWEAGNKYIYTLDFTNGASYSDPALPGGGVLLQNEIQFDVDIVPWNETIEYIPNQEVFQTDLLIGKWSLTDAKISVSYENEVVNERYLENPEDAQQFGGAKTIEFISEDTFIIDGLQDPAHILIQDGVLYITGSGLPTNVTIYIKSFNADNFTLEYYFTARDIEYGENGADLLYTFTFNYIKETWSQDIIGTWYFKSAMLTTTNKNNQIQERRKLGSVEFAESFGFGISELSFSSDLNFEIIINKLNCEGFISGTSLNIDTDILQTNYTARVKSCNKSSLIIEISYSDNNGTKNTLIFDFSHNENTIQQKWRENIIGQWEFKGIDELYIYDDGTIEESTFDQEFNPAFNQIDFKSETTFYLLDVTNPFAARLEDGLGLFLDVEYMKLMVNEITPVSMTLSMSSRVNLDGKEVYQERVAHYAKLD